MAHQIGKNVVLLILNQQISKLFTFVLTVLLVRSIGAELYGIASINLYLVYTSVQFLAREPFRRSTLQAGYAVNADGTSSVQSASFRSSIKTSYLILPMGCIVAICSLLLTPPPLALLTQNTQLSPYTVSTVATEYSIQSWVQYLCKIPLFAMNPANTYLYTAIICCLSALLELTVEPLHLVFIRLGYIQVRVKAEFAMLCVRGIAMYFLVPLYGLFGFGMSYFVGSIIYCAVYIFSLSLINAKISDFIVFQEKYDNTLLSLTKPFITQSLHKLLLTEGEKMFMVTFSPLTLTTQGIYVLVQNQGSLILRLLFQPIEEAAALQFGSISRDISQQGDEDASKIQNLRSMTITLSQIVTFISLQGATFGPALSSPLLRIVYGEKWSSTDAPRSLSIFCALLICFALNGVIEALFYSTITSTKMKQTTKTLSLFSIVYILLMYALTMLLKLEDRGIMLANAVIMISRIIYSLYHINIYILEHHGKEQHISDLLPAPSSLGLLSISSIIAIYTQITLVLSGCVDSSTKYCIYSFNFETKRNIAIHLATCIVLALANFALFLKNNYQGLQQLRASKSRNKTD